MMAFTLSEDETKRLTRQVFIFRRGYQEWFI